MQTLNPSILVPVNQNPDPIMIQQNHTKQGSNRIDKEKESYRLRGKLEDGDWRAWGQWRTLSAWGKQILKVEKEEGAME